jgi:cobalt-zinc-cadmium efflux system membrane fusion protein
MKKLLHYYPKGLVILGSAGALAVAALLAKSVFTQPASASAPHETASAAPASTNAPASPFVDLSPSQLGAIKIEPVGTAPFSVEKMAVGSIDYDEDLSVQVFSPYQGKIIAAFCNLGDEVQKGQPLYTIDSPDLVQAESTLIGAAAVYDLTSKEFARAKELSGTNGVSQREFEQSTSDQQSAEGALKAARDAVRVFGKTDTEIDQIVASRKIDPALVARSPVTGRITSRNAQSGLLVQPGNAPAPYSVADLSTKWMVANVIESDSPLLRPGQPVEASAMAYPGRVFAGKIAALGATVDPNTHRVMLRCELPDPKDELRPGMLASFAVQVREAAESVALPANGAVRDGDGTMVAWVTTDRKRFTRRIVQLGLQKGGQYQVLDGLKPGELAVTDGAVFISNLLNAPPSD